MNLHLQHSERQHLPKLPKMNTQEQYLKDKFFHPNLQLPVVEECYHWVEKFKSGTIKKSEATFEIYSILTASGENSEVVKAAAESYVKILNQHKSLEHLQFLLGSWLLPVSDHINLYQIHLDLPMSDDHP
jgi:hypothetical protein